MNVKYHDISQDLMAHQNGWRTKANCKFVGRAEKIMERKGGLYT